MQGNRYPTGTLWQIIQHTCAANHFFLPANPAYPDLNDTSREYQCVLNEHYNASEWKLVRPNGSTVAMDNVDCLPSRFSFATMIK